MGDRLPEPLRRVGATFGSFTAGQKAVTLLGIVVLAVGGFFFATWASKPAYAPLFSNLAGTDASAIVEKLNASGTPYELADGGGTVLVPKDQVYDVRLQMSGEGLPAQDDTGYALLDKQGITTSDFMQHVGYQRAMEGELAKTIKSIEGVKAATVHLVIPQKDIFSDDEKHPTASVLVASQAGKELDNEQVQAIVHLVASSVEGLDPKQVTVAGADGTVLSTGDGKGMAGGIGGDVRSQQTEQFQSRLNNAVQRMLESVLGPGKAVVNTTADLDFDETETKTQRYDAKPGVPPLQENNTRETYTGTGGGNGGVLGPDNIQVPNGAAAGGNGQYESTAEQRTNAVDLITETRKSAPGGVRKLNVAVLLDGTTAQGIDQAAVQQMVAAAVGLDAARGDTIAVTALPFDDAATKAAQDALAAAGEAEEKEQLYSMAKTGAMALAVLILMLLAWRASRKSKRARLTEEELAQLAEMQAALDRSRLQELAAAEEQLALEGTPDVEADARVERQREISEMVNNQPEEVAQLLRGWLADRRS
ncbi:MAG TPA: flagellar basal-body MS-ring/collar protein FliF [Pilimelia sp.]|nr:flagellar basal-body MS-ring/collar protein FliF [Pilimelia sp.]